MKCHSYAVEAEIRSFWDSRPECRVHGKELTPSHRDVGTWAWGDEGRMRSGAHGATALHGPWQVTNGEALVGVPSFSAPGCGALAGQATPSVGRVCPPARCKSRL